MAITAVDHHQQTSIFRRGFEATTGVLLWLLAGFLSLACVTWTVTDPSLSQSNQNMVENAAGPAGAIVADLMMQVFGLGAVLVIAWPAIWGTLLLAGRPIGRISRRGWYAVGGIVLTCAAIGCFQAPESWPLPIGIGGVAGDLVLRVPASLFGGYPSGFWAIPLALIFAVPAIWLDLMGAGLIGRDWETRHRRMAGLGRDEEDEEAGEGKLSLVIGACAHAIYSAKAAYARRRDDFNARREPAEFGDRFDDWHEEDMAPVHRPAPSPRPVDRSIRVAMPGERASDFDAAEWQEDDDAEPYDRGYDDQDRDDGNEFGETDPWASVEEALGPGAPDRVSLDPDDRVTAKDEEQDTAGGGWRGLLSGNIVAFPGKRGQRSPEDGRAEPRPPRVDDRPRPASAQGGSARAPQSDGGTRVVPQQTVTADQQRLRTGSGRAVALKPQATTLPDPKLFELPSIEFLSPPKAKGRDATMSPEALQENARLLEGVLEDFGVKGEIIEVRPGPVVTLYELEPAPGIKSSRVIGLADDIARSMSAIAARVAVIPGKNAIGIELPNQRRETVYYREMIASDSFSQNKGKLPLVLGKTIGGEAVIADLAKMPHLLVAGTTGSGKSVSINTMILSLLYRFTPAECRLIMIDPKMLELSIYDGIPHLLSPVVTDPKKAVVALKWTVREMEDRYRKMSKVGVRNIDGFNSRVKSALDKGETISRTVQTGFDRETGEPIFETEEFDLEPLPYIVVIIDEMADLMMVAGKDIEGAVQRLAQMARAAGIHVIMATQRPSVDVITGTIKANFPTRISFQVTSKIDSRTILGEQGAEQLLGMGDMLFMAGGGRIQRVHGPFVDDAEVEAIVNHLKSQGVPDYLDAILEDEDEDGGGSAGGGGGSGGGSGGAGDDSADPYDQAVAVVLRDGKASTSYIQRRLGIGYNRAASIIEKMEQEGIVGPANHAGKREILVPTEDEM